MAIRFVKINDINELICDIMLFLYEKCMNILLFNLIN